MCAKTGRPKAENPKDIDLKVRVDEQTHKELLRYSKEHNISKAEAIRKGIELLLQK